MDYVKIKLADSTSSLKSPIEVSNELHKLSNSPLENLKTFRANNNNNNNNNEYHQITNTNN